MNKGHVRPNDSNSVGLNHEHLLLLMEHPLLLMYHYHLLMVVPLKYHQLTPKPVWILATVLILKRVLNTRQSLLDSREINRIKNWTLTLMEYFHQNSYQGPLLGFVLTNNMEVIKCRPPVQAHTIGDLHLTIEDHPLIMHLHIIGVPLPIFLMSTQPKVYPHTLHQQRGTLQDIKPPPKDLGATLTLLQKLNKVFPCNNLNMEFSQQPTLPRLDLKVGHQA